MIQAGTLKTRGFRDLAETGTFKAVNPKHVGLSGPAILLHSLW